MALKLRRGTEAERLGVTPAEGELLYVTDHISQDVAPLWVGDGSTAGGNPVASLSAVMSVNGQDGVVSLTTDDIDEPALTPTNLWFTSGRAKDSAANALANGTHSGISFAYNTETKAISATVSSEGIVGSGFAGEIPFYAADGTTLSSAGYELRWDTVANSLIVSSGSVRVSAGNGGRSLVVLESNYTGDLNNAISLRRSRGTTATPTQVSNGDSLHVLNFQGYDGASYDTSASIIAKVSGVVSTGVVPGTLFLQTTGSDGITDPRVRITDSGKVNIGPFSGTETGSGRIEVRQSVSTATEGALVLKQFFEDALGTQLAFVKYRGTQATPAAVIAADMLSEIRTFGFNGTNLQMTSTIRGYVNAIAAGKIAGGVSIGVTNDAGTYGITTRFTTDKLAQVGNIEATGTITGTEFISTGTGTPALVSATNLDLSAGSAVRVIGGGTFRLPQLTTTQRDAISVPVGGDMIYNTTTGKVQAYQGGVSPAWVNLDGTP